MSGSRSIAVLGPIPRDRITTHNGEVFEKYGCALYTVAALAALLDDNDRILPIVHVRREDEDAIKELLSAFPNVDLTGIRSESDHGAVVELTYTDQANRIEQQTGFMDPITPADVEFALHADAFVCVPITDYEVGQATLAYIRSHSDGTILLDAHGPTSTLVIGGERRRRLWVERDSWLPHIDLLKMNLEEAGCSWFPSQIAARAPRRRRSHREERLPDFAAHCLRHGVQAVCVTLDQRGCVAYWLDEGGALVERRCRGSWWSTSWTRRAPATRSPRAWRSATCRTHDIVRRPRSTATRWARSGQRLGPRVYRPLAETNKQIADTYGSAFKG